MRNPTQPEYDNRDKSMTHYAIGTDGDISFHDQNKASGWMPDNAKVIPDMEFDISKHEFSSSASSHCDVSGSGNVYLYDADYDTSTIIIQENDSIALAKHFGHYKEPTS